MTIDSSHSLISALRSTRPYGPGRRPQESSSDAAAVEQQTGPNDARYADSTQTAPARASEGSGTKQLSAEEKREVEKLKKRDREVRAHEQAHLAAAGGYARGGAKYTFETGPDGRRYATGGEVPIDTSEVPDDPQATIRKMAVIRKAALAPQNPSGADRNIAASAAMKSAQAMRELMQEKGENTDGAEESAGLSSSAESARETQNQPTYSWQARQALAAYSQAAFSAF